MMQRSDPFISVILPVYNSGDYVGKTIESVLRQTYSNFEFIIINDGSNDNSDDVISKFNDPRIKYFKRENLGLSATLRELVDNSHGEYIARIDADDLAHEDRLEVQVSYFLKDEELALVGSNVEYIDELDNILGRSLSVISDSVIKKQLMSGNIIFHPSVMFRKSVYYKSGGYDLIINKYCEDFLLWKKMSKHGKFYICNKYLLQYRVHSGSISSNSPERLNWFIKKIASQGEYDGMYCDYQNVSQSKIINVSTKRRAGYKISSNVGTWLSVIKDVFYRFKLDI